MNKIDKLFSMPHETICGAPEAKEGHIFTLSDESVVHRIIIDLGLCDEKNILLLADTHFACLDEDDLLENNPLVLESYERRKAHFPAERVFENAKKVMSLSGDFEKTVLLGDSMDFLSRAGLKAIDSYVYSACPDAMVLVGNHDDTRIAGHKAADETSRESREKILAAVIKTITFMPIDALFFANDLTAGSIFSRPLLRSIILVKIFAILKPTISTILAKTSLDAMLTAQEASMVSNCSIVNFIPS